MTVIIKVGRRVPKSWFRRKAQKVKELITFQENIWQMLSQSLSKAKKSADKHGGLKFMIERKIESEDIHYNLEWRIVTIQGTEKEEEEEYNESLGLYDKLGKQFKKDYDVDTRMSKIFNSKILGPAKIKEAYDKGYGSVSDKSIVNKLLEMGIMTHIEWIKDFDSRF